MVASEDQKEYYTKLTDTLRRYIEERYGFSAMEMTSSEIIGRLMASGDEQSLKELSQLFMTADLVKFAKYSTMINENDQNLVNAIDFINQTKLENQPTEETIRPQLSVEDQRTQKERRILKCFIVGLMLLFNTLNEAPGLFIGFALSIIEIDALPLFSGWNNSFWVVDPSYGKNFPRDAVVAEKVFPKVCGILDDFAAGRIPVRTNQERCSVLLLFIFKGIIDT